MSDPLAAAAAALIVCALAGLLSRRLSYRRYCGMYAFSEALLCIDDLRTDDHLGAVISAALCAWFAAEWWRGGGGDGIRRRLRSLRRRFQAVRRTAPQPT